MLENFDQINNHPDIIVEYQFKRIASILDKKLGCTYLSYIIENELTGTKIKFSSKREWDDFYYFKNEITNCHLANFVKKMHGSPLTFRWNDVKPDSHKAKQINNCRLDYNLGNGMSFVTWIPTTFGTNCEIISMAGDLLDIFFPVEVLQNKTFMSKLLLPLRNNAILLLKTSAALNKKT